MVTHVPNTASSLPKSVTQSQVQPQHIPIPWTQPHQLVNPTCIGPKIQHKPSPPYHDPYARPPPRPHDITDLLDSQKDLLDNDSDQKDRNRGNLTIPGGHNFRNIWETRYILCTRASRIKRLNWYYQVNSKVFTQTDRHWQNIRHHKEKGFKGYAFAPYHQRNSSRLPQ